MSTQQIIHIYFDGVSRGPFTDHPRQVPRQQYDAAREFLVSRWSSLPRPPLAIYQISQVNVPGLSDLDFVVLFKDGEPIDWSQFSPQAFPGWVRQVLTHPPLPCTKSVWPNLSALHLLPELECLWGDALPGPKVPDNLVSGCALGKLVNDLLLKLPAKKTTAWQRPLRLRTLLNHLSGIRYDIRRAELAGLDVPENAKQIISEIDALRESWFDLDQARRLRILARACSKVCDLAGELISQIDRTIVRNVGGLDINHGQEITPTSFFDLMFRYPWSFEEAKRTAYEHYSESGRFRWVRPLSFLQLLAIRADECPKYSKYLRVRGVPTTLQWDGGVWNEGLRHHARCMTLYEESVAKVGATFCNVISMRYPSPLPFWRRVPSVMGRLLRCEVGPGDVMRKIAIEANRVVGR